MPWQKTMTAEPLFHVKNVRYKKALSVDNLTITAGNITCLVGKSGGGKTTLLRLLNKMISPDTGEVFYRGTPLSTLDSVAHRRRVVMLHQKPYVFPGTIRDNLLRPLTFRSEHAEDATLLAALKRVSLDKALDTDAETLSGGEAQRLALARLMVLDVECVLLDEPSSALDEATESDVINAVVSYVKTHALTLVMITHSKTIAQQHGDAVYTINNGHIKEGT